MATAAAVTTTPTVNNEHWLYAWLYHTPRLRASLPSVLSDTDWTTLHRLVSHGILPAALPSTAAATLDSDKKKAAADDNNNGGGEDDEEMVVIVDGTSPKDDIGETRWRMRWRLPRSSSSSSTAAPMVTRISAPGRDGVEFIPLDRYTANEYSSDGTIISKVPEVPNGRGVREFTPTDDWTTLGELIGYIGPLAIHYRWALLIRNLPATSPDQLRYWRLRYRATAATVAIRVTDGAVIRFLDQAPALNHVIDRDASWLNCSVLPMDTTAAPTTTASAAIITPATPIINSINRVAVSTRHGTCIYDEKKILIARATVPPPPPPSADSYSPATSLQGRGVATLYASARVATQPALKVDPTKNDSLHWLCSSSSTSMGSMRAGVQQGYWLYFHQEVSSHYEENVVDILDGTSYALIRRVPSSTIVTKVIPYHFPVLEHTFTRHSPTSDDKSSGQQQQRDRFILMSDNGTQLQVWSLWRALSSSAGPIGRVPCSKHGPINWLSYDMIATTITPYAPMNPWPAIIIYRVRDSIPDGVVQPIHRFEFDNTRGTFLTNLSDNLYLSFALASSYRRGHAPGTILATPTAAQLELITEYIATSLISNYPSLAILPLITMIIQYLIPSSSPSSLTPMDAHPHHRHHRQRVK